MYKNNYKNAKKTCKRLMTSRFHAGHPSINQYIVSEKLHASLGRWRDKKTANNKIVTLMRREKQTNTSVVYVSTQKQRHKLNILGTLKLADCMDIKYNNTILYNNLQFDRKYGQRGLASKVHRVLRNNNF